MARSITQSSPSSPGFGYPVPLEGPKIPYKNDAGSNPVLRGVPLAVLSTLISSSSWLQGVLWSMNKFDQLREIRELKYYEPRYDPTVIPISRAEEKAEKTVADLLPPPARINASAYYTCGDYHAAYKAGKVTPLEVAEALLPLIRRDTNPPGIHSVAFLESKVDIIRKAAKASTERYKAGKSLSILDGIPISVKDEVDLAGYKRTLGTQLDLTNPIDQTGWCVMKWEEAGAIIVGKNNMHDGGGSVRIPASFCGVYGLKPSHGRISGRPTNDLGCSVGVYGPLAASLDDLAVAYRIMAQPDPGHSHSSLFPSPFASTATYPKILGVCDDWVSLSDPDVKSLFDQAISFYQKSCGYEVVKIKIPFLQDCQKSHALTILSEIRSGYTPAQMSRLSHPNQILLNVAGNQASAQTFLFAQRMRALMMKHLAFLYTDNPGMIIVTPTTPMAGLKIGKPQDVVQGSYGVSDGDQSLRSMVYTYMANFTGNAAISFPMGYVGDVPVGLMGMGDFGNSEEQLLAFAKEGEAMLGEEGVRRPKGEGVWVDVLSQ